MNLLLSFKNRPISIVLFFYITGIICGEVLPYFKGLIYIFPLCLIILYLICKRRPIFIIYLFFLFFGFYYIQITIYPNYPQNHVTNFVNNNKYIITGFICDEDPYYISGKTKFNLEVKKLTQNGISNIVTGKIRVSGWGHLPDLSYGDHIEFESKLRFFENFKNPGAFDYERFMLFKDLSASAYFSKKNLKVIQKNNNFSVESIRREISLLIESVCPKESKGILKALIIGKKYEIPKYIRERFNRIGLGHVLAISGLHIGMIASISFLIFRFFLTFFIIILWRAKADKFAAILTFFPVILYGFISGMFPSSQRAVIIICIFLAGFIFERERDSLNSLAIAAFIILLIDPLSLFSISFQLSFSAVFFIIYGLSKCNKNEYSEKFIKRIYNKIKLFIYVSFFAIIGTLPISLHYFNETSFIGIISNLLILPIFGFIVIPCGLSSILFLPFCDALSEFLILFSGKTVALIINFISIFSDWTWISTKTCTPSFFEILCCYILIFTFFNWKKKYAKYAFALIFIIILADMSYWIKQRYFTNELKITILDVKTGNSALIEFPGGKFMLVDGGGIGRGFDIGEMVIAPFLWKNKIISIDNIVLTHPDHDHIAGLVYITKHFNVKEVWSNKEKKSIKVYDDFIKIIKKKNIKLLDFKNLTTRQIGKANIEFLYPPKDFLYRKYYEKWRTTNNNSLVFRLSFGKHSFLFTGDIEKEAENELIKIADKKLKSNVLMVPHHGSSTSSTTEFIKSVKPDIAIISVGKNNRHKLPNSFVINNYQQSGCKVFRTDQHGAIIIKINDKDLRARSVFYSSN